jgi:hypothetical protein
MTTGDSGRVTARARRTAARLPLTESGPRNLIVMPAK